MNKNINNHNGKEIHRDQVPKNVRKEGEKQPVDRVKKKNPDRGNESQSGEPRKTPINVQKKPTILNKNAPKGQVIKLGDKDKAIHPVDSPVRKNQPKVVDSAQASANGKSFTKQAPTYNRADNSQNFKADRVQTNDLSNTPKYLYVFAAILFIAWIIGFFFYQLGANMHMVLALAIVVGIISYLQGRKK